MAFAVNRMMLRAMLSSAVVGESRARSGRAASSVHPAFQYEGGFVRFVLPVHGR